MTTTRRETAAGRAIRMVGVVLLATAAVGCLGLLPRTGGKTKPPEPIPAGTTLARFQALVFELNLPADRVTAFDAPLLGNQTRTAEDFEKALQKFGAVKVLYRVDQTVSLKEAAKVMVGNQVPVVTARRTAASGQNINTIQYRDVGVIFQLAAPPKDASDQSGRQLDVELAVAGEPGEATTGAAFPSFRNVQMSRSGVAEFGKPYVMASIDSSAREKDQPATAYICRVVLDPAQ